MQADEWELFESFQIDGDMPAKFMPVFHEIRHTIASKNSSIILSTENFDKMGDLEVKLLV